MGRPCSRHEKDEKHKRLATTPQGKMALGRTRHRGKDNIKIGVKILSFG
jgi:hypothetical protein